MTLLIEMNIGLGENMLSKVGKGYQSVTKFRVLGPLLNGSKRKMGKD
jgi:hypothetical protein